MKIQYLKNMLVVALIFVAANARADGSVVPVDTVNWTQISDLPTVFINVRNNQDINTKEKTETYYTAHIVIVDKANSMLTMNDNVQIRGRGNSTWNSAKKPYRLKFFKSKQLLGTSFAKNKSWTLLANAADKTMIRNALTYDLGKFADMKFCPAAKFVDLVLNGQYRGTYQISDQVNVDGVKGKRVNIDEDYGWFLEMASWNAAEAPYVQVNSGGCFNIKNPEYDTSTTEGTASTEALKTEVLTFCQNERDAVLAYGAAYTSPTKGWRAYLDESSLINYLVTTEMIGNVDAYTSIYLYKDKDQTKLSFGPLWDEDLGYNNCPTSGDFLASSKNLTYELHHNSEFFGYQVEQMLKEPTFAKAVLDRWKALVDGGIQDYLIQHVESLATVISTSKDLNYSLDTELTGSGAWSISTTDAAFSGWQGAKTHSTYAEYITDLEDYIRGRIPIVTARLQAIYDADIASKRTITLDAKNAQYQFNNAMWDATTSSTNLNAYADVNITNRTFDGTSWNTICLPFSATAEQIIAAFGGKTYQLRELSGMAADGSTMLFTAPKDGAIEGGKPYLIRLDDASATVKDPTFSGVVISDNAPATVTIDGKHSFCGTFYQTTLTTTGTNLFVGADNNLYTPASGKNTIYGMRGYFIVPASSVQAKISIAGDDFTTGISNVATTKENGYVYDLQGRRVGNSLQGLPHGIYIMDGNKIMVK
jgi:hypothetical protein